MLADDLAQIGAMDSDLKHSGLLALHDLYADIFFTIDDSFGVYQ